MLRTTLTVLMVALPFLAQPNEAVAGCSSNETGPTGLERVKRPVLTRLTYSLFGKPDTAYSLATGTASEKWWRSGFGDCHPALLGCRQPSSGMIKRGSTHGT